MRHAIHRGSALLLCAFTLAAVGHAAIGCSDDAAGGEGGGGGGISSSSSGSTQSGMMPPSGSGGGMMPPSGSGGGMMPPSGSGGGMMPPAGAGGGGQGGPTPCSSDDACVDACPEGSLGCGCADTHCAPTCTQDSDCPAPPMGEVSCQEGYCIPSMMR